MCDFLDTFVRRCAVCGGGYGSPLREERSALRTGLQNYASAADFLAAFDLAALSVAEFNDVDLCNFCLSAVLTCDSIMSLFWRKIAALRDLKFRIPCEPNPEVVSFVATTGEPRAVRRRKIGGTIRPSVPVVANADHPRMGPLETPRIASNRSASNNCGNVAEVNALSESGGTHEGPLLRHTPSEGKHVHEVSQDLCGSQPSLPVAISVATEEDAAADGSETSESESSAFDGDKEDDSYRVIPAGKPPKRRHRIFVHRTKVSNCGVRLRICEECGCGCYTAMQLYRHYDRLHANPDAFKCWECGRRFMTQEELGNHVDTHWKEHFGNVTCIDCRKEIRATSVKLHVDLAHGGRLNRSKAERLSSGRTYAQCCYCDHMCGADSQMELHVLQAHPGEGDGTVFQCEECPKRFKEKHSLAKHRHIHRMERHECPTCHKTFTLRMLLRQHMKTHTGAKVGLCTECGRRLSKLHMANHMATEHGIGEIKYCKCHLCPSKYKTSKSLKRHLAREHGIGTVVARKKVACEKCGKDFSSRELYVLHVFKEHDMRLPGMKEYACIFCDKVSFARNNHNTHMWKVHGHTARRTKALQPFLCKICSAPCAERKLFLEHLKVAHDLVVRGKNAYREFVMPS